MENADNLLKIDGYKRMFEALPSAYLILLPNPEFTIIAVDQAYLDATNTTREKILGKPLFEIFPDDPDDPTATGVRNLTESLNAVLKEKKINHMAVQKYNIPRPEGGQFEKRYWNPCNVPVVDDTGNVICIIHNVTDVTEYAQLQESYDVMVNQVQQSSGELVVKMKELQDLNTLLIEREDRMANLKAENDTLREQIANLSKTS